MLSMHETMARVFGDTSATVAVADARPPSLMLAFAPIVDVSGFMSPDAAGMEAKRDNAVETMLRALQPPASGFFRVTGHGIDARVLESARLAIYAFEAAPASAREEAKPPATAVGFVGYAANGSEKTGAIYDAKAARADGCSCFSVGPPDDDSRFEHNVFPPCMPEVQTTAEALYAALDALDSAMYLLFNAALSRAAPGGEPCDEIMKFALHGARKGLLRAKFYAPNASAEQMAGHSDVTPFTILHADGPGLEIASQLLDRDTSPGDVVYEWRPAPPLGPGELFVNTGEIIRALSNDRFRSCVHRVGRSDPTKPRLSIAFFSAACCARGLEPTLLRPITVRDEPSNYPPWHPEDFIGFVIDRLRGTERAMNTGT